MHIEWALALENVRKYSFQIHTPNCSGTGFQLIFKEDSQLCGIATAYHVIEHANLWEGPIRLTHTQTGFEKMLRASDRFIFVNPVNDIAVIMCKIDKVGIVKEPLQMAPQDKWLKPGIEIGWAGYPAVAPNEFSFFSGRISCYLRDAHAYLVDGVAINGVSGGPAFTVLSGNNPCLIGIISAYIPNRATGESLPGVCSVTAIHPFYDIIKEVESLDEARKKSEEMKVAKNKTETPQEPHVPNCMSPD